MHACDLTWRFNTSCALRPLQVASLGVEQQYWTALRLNHTNITVNMSYRWIGCIICIALFEVNAFVKFDRRAGPLPPLMATVFPRFTWHGIVTTGTPLEKSCLITLRPFVDGAVHRAQRCFSLTRDVIPKNPFRIFYKCIQLLFFLIIHEGFLVTRCE